MVGEVHALRLAALPLQAALQANRTTHYGGAQVSHEPPPLPGGYIVGEQVYFTGASQAFGLEHGKQGEVVGPATFEGLRGKGVAVRYSGNTGAVNCYLHQVRRRRRCAATHSSPPPQLPLHTS